MKKLSGMILTLCIITAITDISYVLAAETKDSAITFTDSLNREVSVNNPQRVAALLGSYAHIWYLAGGEICASADDAWEDFDLPLGENVVNLGMTKDLSLEKLFEADPDFILASSNTSGNVEWMDILEETGIPTAYFEVADFEDYLYMLDICTQITGHEEMYEQNGLSVKEEIEGILKKSREHASESAAAPKVLNLRASGSMLRAKNSKGNVLGEILKDFGCDNIADSEESLLENLSMEQIILQDPDYIFVAQVGADMESAKACLEQYIKENPAWSELSAVKNGQVHMMEKELYTFKPNDRWGEAYEKVYSILYGK